MAEADTDTVTTTAADPPVERTTVPAPVPAPAPVAPPTPVETEAGKELIRSYQRSAGFAEESIKSFTESEKRKRAAEEKKAEISRPIYEELTKQAREPLPKVPDLPKTTPPPKRSEYARDIFAGGQNSMAGQWMNAVTQLAAMSSTSVQGRLLISVQAMRGLLQGEAAGNDKRSNDALSEWKENNAYIEKTYQNERTHYNDIISNKQLSYQQKLNELKFATAELGDQIAFETADQGSIEKFWGMMEKRETAMRGAINAEIRMDQRLQAGTRQLSDEAIDFQAGQALEGAPETRYMRGIRAGSVDEVRIRDRIFQMAKEQGITPAILTDRQAAYAAKISGAQAGGRAAATAPIQIERQEAVRFENMLNNLRSFEGFTESQLKRLVELGNRRHRTLGIPIADAIIQRGQAAALDDPDAAAFLAQLPATRNEVERILTTNGQSGTLSVYAQKSGEGLISAGYGTRTLNQLYDVFRTDFASRKLYLTEEANRHRQALRDQGVNIPLLDLPEVPPLPPAGGRTAPAANTPVGETRAGRGGIQYRKKNDGPDTDRSNWEEVK